ncbi:MAG TPA: hypothetical protein VI756_11470 [Blastocatellia bacterium]
MNLSLTRQPGRGDALVLTEQESVPARRRGLGESILKGVRSPSKLQIRRYWWIMSQPFSRVFAYAPAAIRRLKPNRKPDAPKPLSMFRQTFQYLFGPAQGPRRRLEFAVASAVILAIGVTIGIRSERHRSLRAGTICMDVAPGVSVTMDLDESRVIFDANDRRVTIPIHQQWYTPKNGSNEPWLMIAGAGDGLFLSACLGPEAASGLGIGAIHARLDNQPITGEDLVYRQCETR